jgi:hypothetical protein
MNWRKSARSVNNGQCVEVGGTQTMIVVRDTANRDGETLTFPPRAWEAFTRTQSCTCSCLGCNPSMGQPRIHCGGNGCDMD